MINTRSLSFLRPWLVTPLLLTLSVGLPATYHLSLAPADADDIRVAIDDNHPEALAHLPLDLLDQPNHIGLTPLTSACALARTQIVDLLLARGVDANHFDPDQGTPLMAAAYAGNPDLVRTLLHHHADPRPFTSRGTDALTCAVLSGNAQTVQLLLHTPINPNDPRRAYPILCATTATGDRADLTQLLLAAGANPTTPAPDGTTPLSHATTENATHTATLLRHATSLATAH